MKVYDLPCFDNRKSFYGKAQVFELDNGGKVLKSYNTFVCELTPEKEFVKLWDGYSATTMRHINSFLRFLGYENGGKTFWDMCSVNDPIYL